MSQDGMHVHITLVDSHCVPHAAWSSTGGMVVRTSSIPATDGLVCICCRCQCYLALCHSRRSSSGSLSRIRAH